MYGLLSIKNEGFESLKKVIKIDSVKEQGYCVTWSSCIYIHVVHIMNIILTAFLKF